jgi:hypothetical protein
VKSDGWSTSWSPSASDPMVGGNDVSTTTPLGGSESTRRQRAAVAVTLSHLPGGLGGRFGVAAR